MALAKALTPMNCPSCEHALRQMEIAGLTLDRCPQCGGYWLDDGELSALARRLSGLKPVSEWDARSILRLPVPPHKNPQRRCPRCRVILNNFNYCYNSNILLDRCPRCRGIWADAGELPAIASYVKGNRKLDRLATAMADHVRDVEERMSLWEKLGNMYLPLGLPRRPLLALLLVTAAEAVNRLRQRD